MTTTTSYGTYVNATPGGFAINLTAATLEAFGPDGTDGYDFDAIVSAMRDRINENLAGTGITLHGDEFYGPAEPDKDELTAAAALVERADGLDIRSDDPTAPMVAVAIAWEGFWDLVEQHTAR